MGMRDTIDIAKRDPKADSPVESRNARKPNATVNSRGVLIYMIWLKKSFQFQMKQKMLEVTNAGILKGMMIRQ